MNIYRFTYNIMNFRFLCQLLTKALHLLSLTLFLSTSSSVFAQTNLFQMQEKRIYVLDITESMIGEGDGKGTDIFGTVKYKLKDAINSLSISDPTMEIEIIPFSDRAYLNRAYKGCAGNKNQIFAYIDTISAKGRSTNIVDAWKVGLQEMDSAKTNFMFLLTDGNHNVSSIDNLYSTISSWNNQKCNDYCYAFYVSLNHNVNNDSKLQTIADTTRNVWWIHSMNVNVACLQPVCSSFSTIPISEIFVNTRCSHSFLATFAVNNGSFNRVPNCERRVHLDFGVNPYYKLNYNSLHVINGVATIPIEFRTVVSTSQCPRDTIIPLSFTVVDTDRSFIYIVFTPEQINVHFLNRDDNIMTFHPTNKKGRKRHYTLRRMIFEPKAHAHKARSNDDFGRNMTIHPASLPRKKQQINVL